MTIGTGVMTIGGALRHRELGHRWGPSHGLGVVDSMLAAAALELGATVATINVRDFPMFPGLQRPY